MALGDSSAVWVDLTQEARQVRRVVADAQLALEDRGDAPLRPHVPSDPVRLCTAGEQDGNRRPLFGGEVGP